MRLQTQSRRIIPEFAGPVAPEPVDFRGLPGSPKFPRNPHDHSPCSPTPAGAGTCYGTKGQRTRHGPRTKAQRGLQTVANFGAQSHGFWSRCLRLVVMVSHHCTQDSLPATGPSFAGRDSNPQGFYERFLSISTRPPLPSFLGASFVLALFYHCQLSPSGFTGHWPLFSRHLPLSPAVRRAQRGQVVRRPSPAGTACHRLPNCERSNGPDLAERTLYLIMHRARQFRRKIQSVPLHSPPPDR